VSPLLVVSDPSAHPSIDLIDVTKPIESDQVVSLPDPAGGEALDHHIERLDIVGPFVIVQGTLGAWRPVPFVHVIEHATGEIVRSLPTRLFGDPAARPWPK
jgi:hypothetical protein